MRGSLAPRIELARGLTEEAVTIDLDGEALYGNAVVPAARGTVGIVAVHGWSGYRHGPHGLLTCLCRRLAADTGCPTLRFDFRGRGESEGNGLAVGLPTMADDLVAVSDWFRRGYGLDGVVYLGICSGGNVAVGTLKRLPGARGLVLLSVYPFSDGDAFGRDLNRTWHFARVYLHKAMHAETWLRLFKGDVHLKQVANVLFGHFLPRHRNRRREMVKSDVKTAGATAKPSASESRNEADNAPRKHLENLNADTPALMIYGTADPDAGAAQTYYGDYAREKDLPITFVSIEGANHNFSSVEWTRQVADFGARFIARLDSPESARR